MKSFKEFITERRRINQGRKIDRDPGVEVKIPGPTDNYSAGRFNALQPTIKNQDRIRKGRDRGLVTKNWQDKNLTTQDVRLDDKGTTAKITTHKDAAENFRRGLEGLRDAGMPLKPSSIQSYNNRTIRNSKNLSSHGTGGAVDIGGMKSFERWGDRDAADWIKKNPEKYHGVLRGAGLADGSAFTNTGKSDPGHIEVMKSQNPMERLSQPWKDKERAAATGATKTPGMSGSPSGPTIQRQKPQQTTPSQPKQTPGLPGSPSGPAIQRDIPMSQKNNNIKVASLRESKSKK